MVAQGVCTFADAALRPHRLQEVFDMPSYFLLSLGIASGLSALGAVVFSLFFSRLRPAHIRNLHWLSFAMIIAAGVESLFLLFEPERFADRNATLSSIVIVLAIGLAVKFSLARLMKKGRTDRRQNG